MSQATLGMREEVSFEKTGTSKTVLRIIWIVGAVLTFQIPCRFLAIGKGILDLLLAISVSLKEVDRRIAFDKLATAYGKV